MGIFIPSPIVLESPQTIIKHFWVDFHKKFQRVVHHAVNSAGDLATELACLFIRQKDSPIPVRLGILIQCWEYNGQDDRQVVSHQVDNVLIVPIIQGTLSNLEVLRIDTSGQLGEQRNLNLDELGGVNDVEDLLHFVEEHDFLGRIDLGPEFQKTCQYFFCEAGVFLQELDNAVSQLRVIKRQRFDFVQRDEEASQEGLVFFLQGQRKPVDDGT